MSTLDTRVIQVTNVAPTTTKEQVKTLFQFIGRIREVKLFPPEGSDQQVSAKVCYVEFEDSTATGVSLHLTNTVFIDRALIIVPVMDGKIPDESVAMQLTPQCVTRAGNQPSWPTSVVSQLSDTGTDQVITTHDPQLNALGLPEYPPLPSTLDAAKVEEIRRTVYVANLDPKTTPESLISFFSQAGEVKYVRMAGEDTSQARAAYLELTDQRSVASYLHYSGANFNGRVITVTHAKSSINKPLTKSQEASRREVEEAMKKVQEAQSLISAAAAEKFITRSGSRSRRSRSRGSRSRSRSRRRSRSRSKGRHRRSRSRSRRRSRSPRRIRRSRSRSPRRRRSRSRRRRSRSTSRPRRRSRSRSKRRSRTPPKAYNARRSRSRSRGPRRRSRSRTPRRSRSRSRGKGRDKKDKGKDGEKKKEKKKSASRSPSPPTLQREGSAARNSGDDRSPAKLEPRDRSESPAARRRSVSRSPVRGAKRRSRTRSPVRSARRRSPSPRKRRSRSRSPRRSRSPAKKKKGRSPRRSRSGSRHRSKKDKKKDRSRSRERKEKKEKKKNKEDKEKAATNSKVTRDYDDEEKGYNSAASDSEMKSQKGDNDDDHQETYSAGVNHQMVDMDTSD